MSYRTVAANLLVNQSTVCRCITLFQSTGDIKGKDYPPNIGATKLTAIDKLLILELVLEKPGIYLREIQTYLLLETGTEINVSTIMHLSGFTREKMIIRAKQQSEVLRAQYLADITVYHGHHELFVFI